jgi:hypothetical protein
MGDRKQHRERDEDGPDLILGHVEPE